MRAFLGSSTPRECGEASPLRIELEQTLAFTRGLAALFVTALLT
jgi:hypothetical protein